MMTCHSNKEQRDHFVLLLINSVSFNIQHERPNTLKGRHTHVQHVFKSTCKHTHTRDRQVSVNQKLEHLAYLSAGASSPRQMKAVSELSGQGLI